MPSTSEIILSANTQVIDGDVVWQYKALLGKKVDPNFADYCENNPDGFRIGNCLLYTSPSPRD